MDQKESAIQRSIIEYLRMRGHTVWRSYVGPVIQNKNGKRFYSKNEMAGYPDITGFSAKRKNQMFCIEVKTKTGRLSDEQKKWFKLLKRHGVVVFVATSIEDVVEAFRENNI